MTENLRDNRKFGRVRHDFVKVTEATCAKNDGRHVQPGITEWAQNLVGGSGHVLNILGKVLREVKPNSRC